MNPQRYTELADAGSERYGNVLHTFRSLLIAANMDAFSETKAKTLRQDAKDVALAYLHAERTPIETALQETAVEALQRVEKDFGAQVSPDVLEALQPHLLECAAHLKQELAAQLSRDAESLVKRHRQFAIAVNLASQTRGVNLRSDLSSSYSKLETLLFQFRDRAGRSYPAERFIKSTWRQTLLHAAADLYMLGAASVGAEELQVVTRDPTSAWAGYRINLADPTAFIDVRGQIFHPQSNSVLMPV